MRISDWSSDVCSSDLLSLVYLRASIPGRWETITTPNAGGGRCGGQLSGPGDTPGTRCWTRIPAWSYRQKCITRGLAMKPIFEKVPVPDGASWRLFDRRLDAIPFEWHYHPEFELTLTLNSRGQRHVGDHIDIYDDGDLVLLGPNLPPPRCPRAIGSATVRERGRHYG